MQVSCSSNQKRKRKKKKGQAEDFNVHLTHHHFLVLPIIEMVIFSLCLSFFFLFYTLLSRRIFIRLKQIPLKRKAELPYESTHSLLLLFLHSYTQISNNDNTNGNTCSQNGFNPLTEKLN